MIEYAKKILPKVSNWKDLFRKELIKCLEWADPANRDEIYEWCFRNYNHLHEDVLEEVLQNRERKSLQFRKIKDTKSNMSIAVYKNPDFVSFRKKRPEKTLD